jgi:hypothetical protein
MQSLFDFLYHGFAYCGFICLLIYLVHNAADCKYDSVTDAIVSVRSSRLNKKLLSRCFLFLLLLRGKGGTATHRPVYIMNVNLNCA